MNALSDDLVVRGFADQGIFDYYFIYPQTLCDKMRLNQRSHIELENWSKEIPEIVRLRSFGEVQQHLRKVLKETKQ